MASAIYMTYFWYHCFPQNVEVMCTKILKSITNKAQVDISVLRSFKMNKITARTLSLCTFISKMIYRTDYVLYAL